MDSFTDQDSKHFLNKEWLVKIDNANSRPYLFKFHYDKEGHCRILITDTKNVWFEALDSKQFSRRWRHLNNESPQPFEEREQENAWRKKILGKLALIHTLKSVQESVFSIEDSPDADLAIELQPPDCKWRWEGYTLGPKTSAEILSKHLILPLINIAHLSFTSADPVSELVTQDLEQAVDKVAKTGRRSQDVHVRQTLSRPRVATTLRRMTAMFNFSESVPPIESVLEDEDENIILAPAVIEPFDLPIRPHAILLNDRARATSPHEAAADSLTRSETATYPPPPPNLTDNLPNPVSKASHSPDSDSNSRRKTALQAGDKRRTVDDDSATEPESDDGGGVPAAVSLKSPTSRSQSLARGSAASIQPGPSSRPSSSRQAASTAKPHSSSDSSPPRPPSKKAKLNIVPEDSSGESDGGQVKGMKPAASGRTARIRQPIKRGGRRF